MSEAAGCIIGGLVMFAAIIAIVRMDELLSAVTDEVRRDSR